MTLLEKTGTPIGSYAPDFELPGIDNQVHHLRRYLDKLQAVAVILMSNDCPYVQLYLERLKSIQSEFEKDGLTLIGINTSVPHQNAGHTWEEMKAFAARHQLNFPYLWDSTQDVTRSFGASKTPTTFLIDRDGVVRYRGQIDDCATQPEAVKAPYLKGAIACLLTGKIITVLETEPVGTAVTWQY